jgi:hypothetical protein
LLAPNVNNSGSFLVNGKKPFSTSGANHFPFHAHHLALIKTSDICRLGGTAGKGINENEQKTTSVLALLLYHKNMEKSSLLEKIRFRHIKKV